MYRPVMPATKRDRELIADLAAERSGLCKSEVVGIRGLAATDETGLLGDIAQVLPAAIGTWSGNREAALVDTLRLTQLGAFGDGSHLRPGNLSHRRIIARGSIRID